MLGKPASILGTAAIANAMIVSTTSNSTKVKPCSDRPMGQHLLLCGRTPPALNR
jgi:hypothetical protein